MKYLSVYPGFDRFDRFATSSSHYYAVDEMKLHCNLDILYFNDGLVVFTVEYRDYSYKYRMFRRDMSTK